ncbi:MAG TPA: PA domain-containing protein, partial [Solirubrobacteraceae bacterium]
MILLGTSVRSLRARLLRAGAFGALVVACASSLIAAPAAFALSKIGREASRLGPVSDSVTQPDAMLPSATSPLQHGPLFGHLPPVQQQLELVGKLNLISPSTQKPVVPGQVADVAVHKGYAYLNSWDSATCENGGTFVVDIRDPAHPQQIAFIPAKAPFYHGEGAQVLSIDTPQFKGDILAVNDETYGSNLPAPCAPADKTGGGFDLYNVTDPSHPVALVQGAGDRSPESSEVQDPALVGKSYHSVFAWQDGPRAYLVASDNTELSDVDIFDITDPTKPEFVKDLNPLQLPEANQIVGKSAHGNAIFHHDVVVKPVAGHMRMLVSYWDAGYLQLNVDNPANPTYITDTNFDKPDPLTGIDPPEGNAHQAEYSFDNQFILAADEDFAPYRPISKITQAPYADLQFDAALSDAEPIAPGATIAGDTVFVGDACTGTVPAPPSGVTIAVAERGVCPGGFQEKAAAIQAAGYDMGVIFNNSFGAGGGRCETLINMLIDPASVSIPMAFVGRADGLRLLGVFDANTYKCTGAVAATPGDTPAPAVSTPGLTVEFGSVFDGWGYAHLYDANTSAEIDAFAIQEGVDDRYAFGFGDLSIHEFATDPETNLAYSSYYAGGLRVLR